MNANHEIVAEYLYDAWGNILSVTNGNGYELSPSSYHIANFNPLRYRGYVYDNETGFYYLQSRYYDPVVGRFVNLDGFVSTGTGFGGYNMFAYCLNRPVDMADYNGEDAVWLQYPERAGGFGHTSLLIQNGAGEWYYFFWGAESTANKCELITGTKSFYVLDPVGKGTPNNIVTIIDMVSRSSYDEATTGLKSGIYMRGDFSKSYDYLDTLNGQEYCLLTRNCVQTCIKALTYGEFDKYNSDYKKAITKLSKTAIRPNKAYTEWNNFTKNIGQYRRASFWQRLVMKNPHSYIS